MKILLDECLPRRLATLLSGHEVRTVRQMNWHGIKNGKLLFKAEPEFDVFITVDKNLVAQNPGSRKIAIIVIRSFSNDIETLAPLAPKILSVLKNAGIGSVQEVSP